MRLKLWVQHFGLNLSECEDPLNQITQKKISDNSKVKLYLYLDEHSNIQIDF